MAEPVIDWEAATAFLSLFGKNGVTRVRAFPHKATPKEVKQRLGARTFDFSERERIQRAQTAGRGLYVVINEGGDDKDSIKACLAYFAEFDGMDEGDQWDRVRSSGLPEPSAVVATGGDSLHFYWSLREPFTDKAIWQSDMKRLIAHLGSDKQVNDPSRVMRLPGAWYMDGNQQPVAQVQVVHQSDARYTRDDIIRCLPAEVPPSPKPKLAPSLSVASSAKNTEQRALEQLYRIPARTPGTNTRDQYLRLLWGLTAITGANRAAALMAQHSPEWAEQDDLLKIANDANGSITDATFFEVAKAHWGITSEKLDEPVAEPKGVAQGDPLNEWEELLSKLVNPKHALFERNTVRRQIRAATAAADAGLRVSPQQARSRLIAKQRELITGTAVKGTAGGQKVKAPEKKWLISNLIPLQCLTAIAAFAKVGKTKFICAVAASLVHQLPLMGNYDWQPAPGPHKLILWLTDQPAADTNGYLQAVGLMERDGTLHPSIAKLYTEEDDLAWDDQGIDQLLEDITANPGVVLITDSFYANVQRPYGSDQEPEAGGALIDIQTLLSQSQITHLCCFHAPKETGLTGVNAIRGHGSAAGVPSAVVSLHFLERKDPSGNGKWVADKDNPYRRMVVEGRAPYRDLLVRLDGEAGVWSCHGDYSSGVSQLAQGQQADELPDLTQDQRKVLDVIGTKAGLAVKQIAYEWKGREPSKTEIEQCRKKINALVRKRLVSEKPATSGNTYSVRPSHTKRPLLPTGEIGGTQSQPDFSQVVKGGGDAVAGVAEIETHQVPLISATVTTPPPPLPTTLQNDVVDRVPPQSPPPDRSLRVREHLDGDPLDFSNLPF